jgi:hypothetical protein
MHDALKCGDQSRTLHAKFILVVQRKFSQQSFAFWSQREQYLTAVLVAALTADQASR